MLRHQNQQFQEKLNASTIINAEMPNFTTFRQPDESRLASYYGGEIEYQKLLATTHKQIGALEARLEAAKRVKDIPRDTSGIQLGAEAVDRAAVDLQRKPNDMRKMYSKMEVTVKELNENCPSTLDLQNSRAKLQSTFEDIRASASKVLGDVDTLEVDMLRDDK